MSASPGAVSWWALGMRVTALVADATVLVEARRIVERELAAADAAYSPWRADAEVRRLDVSRGRPVAVSAGLLEAVEAALEAARLTDGAVDPTVRCVLQARRAPPGSRHLRIVPPAGWREVACDRVAGTIEVPAGGRLDLGATGKALIADRCAAAVAALGTGALVSVGGDLATAGAAPQDGWQVRVCDDHRAASGGQVVRLASGALATSSTAVRRAPGPGGGHHILDPARGRPAAGPWRTASVAAASCVDANAASTAAIVLGARAPRWLEELGLPARLVSHGGATHELVGWPQERAIA